MIRRLYHCRPEVARGAGGTGGRDKYEISWEDGYLIHPYDRSGDLLTPTVLRSRFLHVWQYLEEHEAILRQRVWFGKSPDERSGAWYGLMYYPDSQLFSRTKIPCPYLSRDTSHCIDNQGTLFGVRAGYGIFLRQAVDLSLFYVLVLLNSRLCSYRFKQVSPEFQAGYKNNEVYISQLPIRKVLFRTNGEQRGSAVDSLKRGYERAVLSGDFNSLLNTVGTFLSAIPDGWPDLEYERSDVVHDLLAFLGEEMTKLHKDNQGEMKRFLGWLEGYLCVPVEDLKSETRLKEYWKPEATWEGFWDALVQNKGRIRKAKLPGNQAEQPVREGFESSTGKLQPILHRIQRTDWLIDRTP